MASSVRSAGDATVAVASITREMLQRAGRALAARPTRDLASRRARRRSSAQSMGPASPPQRRTRQFVTRSSAACAAIYPRLPPASATSCWRAPMRHGLGRRLRTAAANPQRPRPPTAAQRRVRERLAQCTYVRGSGGREISWCGKKCRMGTHVHKNGKRRQARGRNRLSVGRLRSASRGRHDRTRCCPRAPCE